MAWNRYKMWGLGLVLLLTKPAPAVWAQVPVTAFLASAMQDSKLKMYATQVDYLNNKPFKLAPLRGLEIRTQNNQLGSGEQQYGFRISPANPWEVKYTNQVFRARQLTLAMQQELIFKEVLSQRYQMVSDFIYLTELQRLKEALNQNTDNQIKALENQKSSAFFKAEDYVELKLAQMEAQTDLETAEIAVTQKRQEINQMVTEGSFNDPAWTYASVITLPRLQNLADSLLTTPLFTTRLAYREEKIKLAGLEHNLQKANVNPGFIQTNYMPYRFSESKNPMGVSVGVNIPLFNPNKGDMAAKKLDYLEAQSELLLEKKQAEEEVQQLTLLLKNSLAQHHKLEQKIKAYQDSETLSVLNALTQQNPLVVLKFNAQLLKLQKLQLELKHNIYNTYLKLLTAADIINTKPLLNFLSNNLEPL